MRKIILTLLAVSMITPVAVGAQTASNTPRKIERGDWKANMVNLREKIRGEREELHTGTSTLKGKENKEIRKEAKQEIKLDIKDLRSQKVGIFADHLLQRISLQIKNLENLLARATSRVKEMSVAGKDVTAINSKIAAAQASLDTTKAEFSLLPAKLDLIRTSTNTQLVIEAKNSASSTISKIRDTHAKIIEVINLIKSSN